MHRRTRDSKFVGFCVIKKGERVSKANIALYKAKLEIEKILKDNNVSLKSAGIDRQIFLVNNNDKQDYVVMSVNKKDD